MLMFFIAGLSPVKLTFPVTVAASASFTAAAGAAAGASSFLGASEVSLLPPQPHNNSSEAAEQPIKNFLMF